jgi:hypothetical protein
LIKEGVDKRLAGSGSIMAKYSNPSDMVTETDQAVEAFVKEKISTAYPSHKYIFHSIPFKHDIGERWLTIITSDLLVKRPLQLVKSHRSLMNPPGLLTLLVCKQSRKL